MQLLTFCCLHMHQSPSSAGLSVLEVLDVLGQIYCLCAPGHRASGTSGVWGRGRICCVVQISFMLNGQRLWRGMRRTRCTSAMQLLCHRLWSPGCETPRNPRGHCLEKPITAKNSNLLSESVGLWSVRILHLWKWVAASPKAVGFAAVLRVVRSMERHLLCWAPGGPRHWNHGLRETGSAGTHRLSGKHVSILLVRAGFHFGKCFIKIIWISFGTRRSKLWQEMLMYWGILWIQFHLFCFAI